MICGTLIPKLQPMTTAAPSQTLLTQTLLTTLLTTLLSQLGSAGPTQHQRLLRLHTPLGADVLLAERLVGHEAIGPSPGCAGFKLVLLALSTNAHLTLADLLGRAVRLDLALANSPVPRPFHGHVTSFARLGSDAGLARYRLVIEPWTAFLVYTAQT
jgi:type VI secretion system secreted protein VgrG